MTLYRLPCKDLTVLALRANSEVASLNLFWDSLNPHSWDVQNHALPLCLLLPGTFVPSLPHSSSLLSSSHLLSKPYPNSLALQDLSRLFTHLTLFLLKYLQCVQVCSIHFNHTHCSVPFIGLRCAHQYYEFHESQLDLSHSLSRMLGRVYSPLKTD